MAHHYDDGPDIAATNKRIKEIEAEKEKLERERERIVEQEKIKNKKAHELSEKLQGLKELRDETEKEIIKTRQELLKYCTHEKTSKKTHNSPGSYLDQAEHHVITICDWCGEELDRKVSYGGYG